MENSERTLLIGRENRDIQGGIHIKKCNNNCCLFVFITIVIKIVTLLFSTEYPSDITKIPYEYHLRLEGIFIYSYVVESFSAELRGNFENEKR